MHHAPVDVSIILPCAPLPAVDRSTTQLFFERLPTLVKYFKKLLAPKRNRDDNPIVSNERLTEGNER